MIGRLAHSAVFGFQALRRFIWFFTRPTTLGVHGIALTPQGKIVLVKLSYAPGWRLPGGGRKRGEDAATAMLRELKEEIGLTRHATMDLVTTFEHRPDHRRGQASLFVVREVEYRPRWSLEVKDVRAFALDALPADSDNTTRHLLHLANASLGDVHHA